MTESEARDVSADGSVVVGGGSGQAFRWANGVMAIIPDDANLHPTGAYGVSPDGNTVVGYGIWAGSQSQGFIWRNGTTSDLGPRYASDVTSDGSIVVGQRGDEAYRWVDGVPTGLGDLPGGAVDSTALGVSADGSVVVGMSHSGQGVEAFRWENDVMTGLGDLPGGAFDGHANAVSADGSIVVGFSKSTALNAEAFRWENGVMVGLGFLAQTSQSRSSAWDISGDGATIVGWHSHSGLGGIPAAFVWRADMGMKDLRDLLESQYGLDMTGWSLREARGVSADGRHIVGGGINPDGVLCR